MRTFRYGFSLVELSIVLAILGVVTAGGLSVGTTVVEQQANIASDAQLDEIDKAIQAYFQVNGFLPCPADRTIALGTAGMGAATNCGAAAPAGVTDTGSVRVGALPVRALGMKDRQIADEFGNRYIYAVTENHAIDQATFENVANTGQITVQDAASLAIASDVSYIVVSAGSDGKGAIRYQTGGATPPVLCGASANLDVENCDNDAIFRDVRFNNGSVAASFFDDFTRWLPKFRLNALASSGGGSLWESNGTDIYSIGSDNDTATGNVAIGINAPTLNDTGKVLHVHEPTGNTAAIHISNSDTGAGASQGTILGHWNTGLNDDFLIWTYANKNMRIGTNNAERITILANGNVGVGQTNPGAARFRVDGAVAADWLSRFYNTGAGGYGVYSEAQAYGFYGKTTVAGNWASRGDSQDALNIGGLGVANAYGVYGVTYRPGGYMGVYGIADVAATSGYGVYGWGNANSSIGTRGHVPNTVTTATGVLATAAGATNNAFLAQHDSSQRYCYIGTAAYAIQCGTAGSYFTGAVGILSAPGVDALTVGGDVLANNYFVSSDERLKHDITPAFTQAALEVIAGIKPVHFIWNKNDVKDIGVIAQDIEKVMPEAVSEDEKGFKRVAYDKLVLPVIEAVKELHIIVRDLIKRITFVEEDVTALQKENADLKQRVERLERLIEESKSHKMDVNN